MYLIENTVFEAINRSLLLPETGGILGADDKCIVTNFYHDLTGKTTTTNYIPDVRALNEVIQHWAEAGIRFVGFVHAHPKYNRRLSSIDLNYARQIKKHCSLSELLMLLYIIDEETQSEDRFIQYVI